MHKRSLVRNLRRGIWRLLLLPPAAMWVCTGASGQTADLPARTTENLIVASYNIQWLGEKPHDLNKLAEVIEHFDICGIVEVKNESALAELASALETRTGVPWGHVFGQRTQRPSGTYYEAYGAVWRRDRAELGGGLISGIWDKEEAFRNDPYMVSFVAGDFDFLLLLIHTRWSDDSEGTREGEVDALGQYMEYLRGFLAEDDIIVAGDFNYSGEDQRMMNMAEHADLIQLDKNPPTTIATNGNKYLSPYDHIYGTGSIEERVLRSAEAADAATIAYGSQSPSNMKKTRQKLSDHIPVFIVLRR